MPVPPNPYPTFHSSGLLLRTRLAGAQVQRIRRGAPTHAANAGRGQYFALEIEFTAPGDTGARTAALPRVRIVRNRATVAPAMKMRCRAIPDAEARVAVAVIHAQRLVLLV